ncbi:MAG TPA: ATP-dependent zinc metalloprotease FtsH [Ktedonobacteraceae bacterium]|nr:ATP-dependent zinc metalloprotease FtsH [Ktedonobacteraceae bacterium]
MDRRNRRHWKSLYRRHHLTRISYSSLVQFLKTHRRMLLTGFLLCALLILLFGVVSLLPAPAMSQPPAGVAVVNYTTFLAQMRTGNVHSVTIQDNQIIGELVHPLPGYHTSDNQADNAFNLSSSNLSLPPVDPAYLIDTPFPAHGSDTLVPFLLSKRVAIQTLPTARPSPLLPFLYQFLYKFAPLFLFVILLSALSGSTRKGLLSSDMRRQYSSITKSHPRRCGDGQERAVAARATDQQSVSLRASRPSVTFADVAGIDEVRAELEEVVQFLRCPQRFDRLGAHIPRGVVLVGAPGTGKTLLAKAVAGEAKVPFFNMSASEFVEMFVGVGASRVRDLFQQARQSAPCVVFIDEIDAVGRKRSTLSLDQGERDQTLNQLLVELDGFEERCAVVVLAATNRIDMLDPALLRPGRFDRRIALSLPDRAGREAILRVHTRCTPLHEGVCLAELAGMTTGMSGADLENLVNEAALCAARRNLDELTRDCFEEALVRVQLGAQRHLVMSEAERRIVAFHESGHALLAFYLPGAGVVSRITILPHGQRLGATQFVQEEDHYNASRETLLERISISLAGRVAEELTFGPEGITTGAEDDLRTATKLAWQMVTHWGMSKQIGPVFVDSWHSIRGEPVVSSAGTVSAPETRYLNSREMAAMIDSEVQSILREAYTIARDLLSSHYDRLALLAQTLMACEHLNRAQFEALLKGENTDPVGQIE